MNLDVANLGQVFTPQHIVSDMLGLIQNTTKMKNPRFLEPSCGNGAFFKYLPQNKVGIEILSVNCEWHYFKLEMYPCFLKKY